VQPYSPERRTALVLCGTGAHGAYHAGVLRALQEAGVKVDVMAGHGAGAAAAALAAIDGGAQLWDASGIWRSGSAGRFYRWKWRLPAAAGIAALLGVILLAPLVLAPLGVVVAATTWSIGAVILAAILVALLMAARPAGGTARTSARRRADGSGLWQLLGAPIDAVSARSVFEAALWKLLRGGDSTAPSTPAALGRRYAEVLSESLGQPGFRELMIVATDLDAHRDLVGALLREPYRREFYAPRPETERRSEALDLAGAGAEHTFDLVAAGLTPPLVCDPYPLSFSVDSYWRGETHRMCDRPAACVRLLEELAAAGVSQAILVSGVAAPQVPHRLRALRLELRHRLGDFLAAAESASLRDAVEMSRLRFDSVYLIAPSHNPVGPFDCGGAYDEASDRRQDLGEVMSRAYEDAYHQFIEPVVGASGERLARVDAPVADLPR
jgi:hypothetical protein